MLEYQLTVGKQDLQQIWSYGPEENSWKVTFPSKKVTTIPKEINFLDL